MVVPHPLLLAVSADSEAKDDRESPTHPHVSLITPSTKVEVVDGDVGAGGSVRKSGMGVSYADIGGLDRQVGTESSIVCLPAACCVAFLTPHCCLLCFLSSDSLICFRGPLFLLLVVI